MATGAPPSAGQGGNDAPPAAGASAAAPATVSASSSRVRTEFAREPDAASTPRLTERPTQSLSTQVAAASQAMQVRQASQSAQATLPTAQAAPAAQVDAQQSQSQVTAQAAYTMIADALVQDRNLLDLIKYA